MRYFYCILIVADALLLLSGVICLLIRLRMRRAAGKVNQTCSRVKRRDLDEALAPFGFYYDETNDAISSVMYPWQREMGYCKTYDDTAFAMYMVLDCEPVYFDYRGGRYLLELWKGQYGCTTGAEIGLYVNRAANRSKAPEKLFYECVGDEERLEMSFVLYRGDRRILVKKALHWWLTGFCVGMYSVKSELLMEVEIRFPDAAMCSAFCESLRRTGYAEHEIRMKDRCEVHFCFGRPRSPQPKMCGRRCRGRVMRRNCGNCRLYCGLTGDFDSTLDKITYLGYCFPLLYRTVIRIGTGCTARKLRRCKRRHCRQENLW